MTIDTQRLRHAAAAIRAFVKPEYWREIAVAADAIDAQAAEIARLREALEESQSLFAAMLHEQRPRCEIEDQMIDNRAALSGESK